MSTFRVTTRSDIPLNKIPSGDETLRSAVRRANRHSGHDKIKLGRGHFRLSIAGRVEDRAKQGDLDIRDDLTIVGAGARKTIIDASALDRVFQVFPGIKLRLYRVTVTGGVSATSQRYPPTWKTDVGRGGGILNEGRLKIVSSIITGNTVNSQFGFPGDGGGGIYNSGPTSTVYIKNSTISENSIPDGGFQETGGGIKNVDGTVTIVGSTIFGNKADTNGGGIWNGGTLFVTGSNISENDVEHGGGAIWNSGAATIVNSTLSDNTAVAQHFASGGRGGAIVNSKYDGGFGSVTITNSTMSGNSARQGGALLTDGGEVSIANSTISGNRALSGGMGGGGVASFDGVVNITDTTVTANVSAQAGGGLLNVKTYSGAVFFTAAVFVRNSIVAGNSAATDDPDASGAFTSLGHNLIGDVGAAGGFTYGVRGDLVGGNSIRVLDPLLGPLQDNGGPTWTHALLPGSLAIDAGDATSATDQRGVARPQEGDGDSVAAADIGAFELKFELVPPKVIGPSGSIDGTAPIVSWNAVKGAVRYEVWLDDLTADKRKIAWTDQATTASWTVPVALAPGHSYRFWLRAHSVTEAGGWSAPVDFNVKPLTASTVTGPPATIEDITPEITWTAVDRAERYEVWIDDLTAGKRKVAHTDQATAASWTVPAALAPGHNFRVWVRALAGSGGGKWSAPAHFDINPLGKATIAAPAGVLDNSRPEITWTAVNQAQRYEVWIDDLTTHKRKVAHTKQATGTSWTVPAELALRHNYRVWVRALAAGEAGKWSAAADFEVQPLLTPTVTSPSGAVQTTTPEVAWTAVDRAQRYEVWIDDLTIGKRQVAYTDQAVGTSWTVPTGLASGHSYRIWLRAHSGNEAGKWSIPVDFEIAL